jgi:GGDEF domain-containing protein
MFRELLRAVQAHCGRDNDWVLRVSNERIAAVCPDTHAAGASHIAARIREAAFFLPSRRGLPLPLAIGIAVTGPESEESADDILTRAQQMLEAARTHPTSLLSVRGEVSPPSRQPSILSWVKDLFREFPASQGRRRSEGSGEDKAQRRRRDSPK